MITMVQWIWINKCLFFLLCLLPPMPAQAKASVDSITISGLERTSTNAVHRYLELETGNQYSEVEIEAAIQRLKNSQLFSQVDYELKDHRLSISLVEKWTLIPIVKLGGASGTTYYVLGVYDPNVMGQSLELGGQYENLGGSGSGVVWFRKPYFSNPRLRLGGDFWSVMRNRSFYDEKRQEIGAWTLDRERQHLFVDWEPIENFRPLLAIDFQKDELSEKKLNDSMIELNRQKVFRTSYEGDFKIFRLGALFGKVNFQEELANGKSFEFNQEFLHNNKSSSTTGRAKIEILLMKILPNQKNFAYRFQAGATNSDFPSQKFFLGGIDLFRGYLDSQVSTSSYLMQNLEYRFHVWTGDHSRVQQVVFSDSSLFMVSENQESAISLGLGWRWIFPKIYRLNLRLDFATTRGYAPGEALAFGLQQFF